MSKCPKQRSNSIERRSIKSQSNRYERCPLSGLCYTDAISFHLLNMHQVPGGYYLYIRLI